MRKFLTITTIICIYVFQANTLWSQSNDKDRPNILFIMCDDLNDYQGVFGGHKQAKTPNIDKLAKNGVRFINGQSNIPVCQPSRNCLFTGVYPHDSQDYGWTPHTKHKVLKHNKTLMQLLQENGYYTAGTGKLLHGNEMEVWDVWGNNEKHNYGPFPTDGKKLTVVSSVPSPYRAIGPIDGGYGRLSDGGQSSGKRNEKGWVYGWTKKPMRYINDNDRDLTPDELHAEWAINKIKEFEKKEGGQPFFLGVGFVRPHTPMYAPDKYFDMFPLDKLELSDWIKGDDKDTFLAENIDKNSKGLKYYSDLVASYDGDREKALKHFLQAYLACVAFVDAQIGKVVNALDKSKLKDNTIIVFTSDHGWQMGEKNYLFKNSVWEESTRVPFIVRTPESKPKGVVEHPVSLVDIYPTLVDYCKLEGDNKKNESGAKLGGFSLRPFIENPKTKKWDGPNGALSVVGVYGASAKVKEVEKQNYSYRTKEWRYIIYSNGKQELYNHKKDPHEWNNLAYDKKYSKVKANLQKEVNKILGVQVVVN